MNDEMQRTMQFILEQQAQFTVNQQKAEERITKLEENLSGVATAQADLVRAQTELARAQTHINEVVAAMLETHKHTEEKLDAFIGVLERYINSRQNGGAKEGDASLPRAKGPARRALTGDHRESSNRRIG